MRTAHLNGHLWRPLGAKIWTHLSVSLEDGLCGGDKLGWLLAQHLPSCPSAWAGPTDPREEGADAGCANRRVCLEHTDRWCWGIWCQGHGRAQELLLRPWSCLPPVLLFLLFRIPPINPTFIMLARAEHYAGLNRKGASGALLWKSSAGPVHVAILVRAFCQHLRCVHLAWNLNSAFRTSSRDYPNNPCVLLLSLF